MTCLDQCMIALSALIGLWMTSLFFLRSTIMTCGLSSSLSFCRTQTNWSDSNVCRRKSAPFKFVIDGFWGRGASLLTQELKPIDAGCRIVSADVYERASPNSRPQGTGHSIGRQGELRNLRQSRHSSTTNDHQH